MDWKKWCFDCKRQTFVAFFPQSGETVCTECAIILEEHSIDKTSELCTFFADESRDNDPNGTTGGFLFSHGLCQNRGSNPNRGLAVAWKTITTMSDRLGLVPTIKDRANETFKRVEDHKSISGRDQDALLAACLYIACRQVDQPRTVKEISSVVDGATKKEIGRAVKYIMKQIGLENGRSVEIGAVHVADYMSRFCSNVVMNNEAVKAAQEAAQKAEEFNIRRSPLPTVAAVIYIITQLTLRDISVANGVSEGMIGNSYKDLHPHISTELV